MIAFADDRNKLAAVKFIIFYDEFPIRCQRFDDGKKVICVDDLLAILRVIIGEIEKVSDQPPLDHNDIVNEMGCIFFIYGHIDKVKKFRQWLNRILSS